MANGDGLLGGFLPAQGSGFEGLLNSPAVNIGLGLLAAGGPSPQPVSLGQALGQGVQFAQNAQQQNLRNQLLRQGLQQRQRRNEAMGQLRGLLEPGTVGVGEVDPRTGIATVGPEGGVQAPGAGLARAGGIQSPEVLGLLAEVAPEQFAQGLLGQVFPQERAEPSLIRNLRAIGIDPMSPEGRQLVLNNLQGQGASDQMLRSLDIQLKSLQAEAAQRQLIQQDRTEEQQRTALRSDIFQQFRDLQEAADIIDRIEGTFVEPGQFGELRNLTTSGAGFIGEQLGLDTSRQRTLATQAERFGQIATRAGVDQFANFQGTITDVKFRTLLENDLSPVKGPNANRLAIADRLQAALDAADAQGLTVPGRSQILQRISDLRESAIPEAPGTVGPSSPPGDASGGFRVLEVE